VFVRVGASSLEPLLPKYEALGKAYMALAGHYSDAELSLICGYMDKASELTERLMADMIAARRPPRLRPSAVCKLRPPLRSPGQDGGPVNQDLLDIGDVARAGDRRHRSGGFSVLGSTNAVARTRSGPTLHDGLWVAESPEKRIPPMSQDSTHLDANARR